VLGLNRVQQAADHPLDWWWRPS